MLHITDGSSVWSVAQHDTISQVDLWLDPLETHVYLSAFLSAEGEPFSPPYTPVRESVSRIVSELEARRRRGQAPRSDVGDSRIRTWRSTFENFGFIFVDSTDNAIRLTQLGRVLRGAYREINDYIEGANDRLAKIGVTVLNRHTLRNPIDSGDYPEDADLRPFHFVWKAMRQLENELHWEELNRVLMKVNYAADEAAAIEHIRTIRDRVRGVYDDSNVDLLGDASVVEGDETKRRITPWFTRAGFGGLLIAPFDDENGYRSLVERHIPLIDEALDEDVVTPDSAFTSRDSYLRYLLDVPEITGPTPNETDRSDIDRVLAAIREYGPTRVVCLSGIPGTGKSRLAKMVGTEVTSGDPYRFAEIQFHENTTYADFIEGFVPRPDGTGFELLPKVFRVMNRRARLDPSKRPYVLLIEEFTRANVHGVLGELITYIEHRDRPFRLVTSQEETSVSPNLIVLATMNPRDKSALVLDHAILRRMHIIRCPSSADKLTAMLHGALPEELLSQLVDWFSKYERNLPFGHGVFSSVSDATTLRTLWRGTLVYFLTDLAGDIRAEFRDCAQEYPWR